MPFAPPAPAFASAGFVKNVVTVKTPLTVVPGRIAYLAPLLDVASSNCKSPTLMMRDNRLSREKKSSMLKYGPSACASNGIS